MPDVNGETLSAYIDGDLPDRERAEVERALEQDPSLQEQLHDIRQLQALAGSLVTRGPARDLWPEIRDRVMAPPWWKRRGTGVTGFALGAAAAMACALLFVPLDFGAKSPAEPAALASARQAYRAAIDGLTTEAQGEAERLPNETRRELTQSLAQVDEAITRAERALREAPEDPFAHRMLLSLYDEKIRVLQLVVSRKGQDEG